VGRLNSIGRPAKTAEAELSELRNVPDQGGVAALGRESDSKHRVRTGESVSGEPLLSSTIHGDRLVLAAHGTWTADHAHALEQLVDAVTQERPEVHQVDIDMGGIDRLDTFGGWVLQRLIRAWNTERATARVLNLSNKYDELIVKVETANREPPPAPPKERGVVYSLSMIGHSMVEVGADLVRIVDMLGAVIGAALRVFARPRSFRLTSVVHHIDRVGWRAVPIILLITFLIGAIIAQQGIFHFRKFGADVYVIDMVGILVLREIGVLIVAIMVAGRSGSAYTAELGSMKMREEMDALRTMGFDPVEVLILPRIIALVIALPMLAFIGSMAALYGGGLIVWLYGHLNPDIYLSRLREAIDIETFEVGMIKAPFMALIIGIVSCVEGMQVKGSAESLGLQTTSSVVKSIFLVIVVDGLFAMFFASIGM
jgi:phospholipid/cholesterol/gamma-HCH transport system permease protein